jgi:hypothetical protein
MRRIPKILKHMCAGRKHSFACFPITQPEFTL